MGWGWEEGKATGVSSVHSWVCCSVAKSCLTLCDPLVYSLPGSSVSGIFRARILDWVATPSSRGSSQPRDGTCVSYVSCIGRQVLYHYHHLGNRESQSKRFKSTTCSNLSLHLVLPSFFPPAFCAGHECSQKSTHHGSGRKGEVGSFRE